MGLCLKIQRQRRPIFGRRCAFSGVSFQGLATNVYASTGLRGNGPALAGNVGAGWAVARPRDGAQDVDVPMLAPPRSRCRLVEAQEGSGEEELSRCALGGGCSPPMLAPVRPRWRRVGGVARRLRPPWTSAPVDCAGLDAGCQRERCASNSTSPASTSSRSGPARLRANWAVRKPCLAPMS